MNEKLELTEEEVNVYSDDCGKIQVDCLMIVLMEAHG